MERPLQLILLLIALRGLAVSILVFMERPLQRGAFLSIQRHMDAVSILVFMERPLQHRICRWSYFLCPVVSILVFMERPLQHTESNGRTNLGFSFNPCFYGTTS